MATNTHDFIMQNATGDIVKVDYEKREVSYFHDPFGRESSGVPEWTFTFCEILGKPHMISDLMSDFAPADWQRFSREVLGGQEK